MDFADHLAGLRRQRGLTQVALAERAGMHVSQLRRYEAGKSEPSLAALRRLAIGLSATTDALVFGADPRLPDNEKLRLAFEAVQFLDDDERHVVHTLIEAFLEHHNARHGQVGPRAPRTPKPAD